MCGIAGILKLNSELSLGKLCDSVERAMNLMSRRGPDDRGIWTDEQSVVLGFCRLAILDLSSNGNQPMISSDGRYVLICNGEIYNFLELKEELKGKGISFRSTGDSEVVLYALATWGTKALERFNGMFALAFYDRKEKKILLARDHAGIKPLYYLLTPEGLFFSSQYDQIMAHPWAKYLKVSQEALGLYLRLGYIPEPYGMLKNTHMLEAGSWLAINSERKIQQEKFFEFPQYQEPTLKGQEAYEAVDEAVTRAIKRQLVSDVPIGSFLSGGIDSPLISAKAHQLSGSKIQAFTIGTNGDEFDESKDASIYAKEIGIQHSITHATSNQALEMLENVIAACGEPFADYSIFPTMLISKIASQKVKVMLSGDGGDELFWGYYGRFASVLEKAKNFNEPHGLRSIRWWTKRFLNLGNASYHLRQPSIGAWYREKHSHLKSNHLEAIFQNVPEWPKSYDAFSYDGFDLNGTAQWLRWNEFKTHLQRVLLKVDRASMYHSLEVRVPFLDREVIDIAVHVDWQSCLDMNQGKGKLPLRHSLAKHVKHQTVTKRGFSVPMNHWLRGPLRPIFEEKVLNQKDILGLEMDQKRLKKIFAQHLSGHTDCAWGLWILLSLALWKEKHFPNG